MSDIFFQAKALSGTTLYCVLRRKRDSKVWRVDTAVWETYASGNWYNAGAASYVVTTTEQTGSGFFAGTVPAGISTVEDLLPVIFLQAGGSPVLSADTDQGQGEIAWTGTTSVDLTFLGTAQTGDNFAYLSTNLGLLGANATALAPSSTALSTVNWTNAKAGYLDTNIGSRSTLAAGAQMDLVNAPNATAITAIQSGLSKPGTAQTLDFTTAFPTSPTSGTVGESFFVIAQRFGRRNTAQAGSAGTITLDASASSVDGTYAGYQIKLTGGTGAGQFATITSYVGSTKVATIIRPGTGGAWATNPDNTTVFMIDPFPVMTLLPGQSIQLASLNTADGHTIPSLSPSLR